MANIFISYRRSDSAPYAGRLHDRLTDHFSDPQVFMDLEIEPGDDFVERLEEGVSQCDVLLVLIGPIWLEAKDAEGMRRLDDPGDYARIEVAAALQRGIRVIPVLVGGAVMPNMSELPQDLVPLARRQALELSDLRFRADADRLFAVIDKELAQRAQAAGAKAADQVPIPDRVGRKDATRTALAVRADHPDLVVGEPELDRRADREAGDYEQIPAIAGGDRPEQPEGGEERGRGMLSAPSSRPAPANAAAT